MTSHVDQARWQREFYLTAEWETKLPSIWELHCEFSLKVIQNVDPSSSGGQRTYLLAHETQCHNGLRELRGLVFLSPSFESISQLEEYASIHSVDIVHAHFYGQELAHSEVYTELAH